MWETGIGGWRPDWRSGAKQAVRQAEALGSLVGAELTGAWSIWIGDTKWFADMPVVLQFDGSRQLKICWQKMDDLSISWNTIDLEVVPQAGIDDLAWRPWRHPAFDVNKGETVTGVAATAFEFTTLDVDHPHRPPRSDMVTAGLWFATTGPGLHIFNALDENGLDTRYAPGVLKPVDADRA